MWLSVIFFICFRSLLFPLIKSEWKIPNESGSHQDSEILLFSYPFFCFLIYSGFNKRMLKWSVPISWWVENEMMARRKGFSSFRSFKESSLAGEWSRWSGDERMMARVFLPQCSVLSGWSHQYRTWIFPTMTLLFTLDRFLPCFPSFSFLHRTPLDQSRAAAWLLIPSTHYKTPIISPLTLSSFHHRKHLRDSSDQQQQKEQNSSCLGVSPFSSFFALSLSSLGLPSRLTPSFSRLSGRLTFRHEE